ncbi:MAG: hypothetical protein JST16_15865 [Bdellovibrionales bacterium]|nr:hypothetical protein [Bdellovibrionales bacterium]
MTRASKYLLALLILTFIAFGRALLMNYVNWDDPALILENVILRRPLGEALRLMFTTYYHGDYMPLTLLSFWIDLNVFHLGAEGQHAINLLLHLGNICLLWLLLTRAGWDELRVACVCVLFALHPVQAESVLWISERKGLLSTLCLLGAVWCSESSDAAASARAQIKWNFGYLGLFVASFLTKATGILLPVLLAVRDYRRAGGWNRRWMSKQLPVWTAAAFGSWVRIEAYRSSVGELASAAGEWERWLSWPVRAAAALGFYLKTLMAPVGLSIVYPPYRDWESWGVELAIFAVTLVGGAWWYRRHRDLRWLAGVAAALAFLAPVLQIVPRINFVNDRYLYLPIIGVAVAFTVMVERRLSLAWVAGLALVLGTASWARSDAWSSNFKLWADTVTKDRQSGLAHNNYAQALQERGQLAEAIREYELTLEYGRTDGTDNLAYNNLANLYSTPEHPEIFDLSKAVMLLRKGIEIAPRPEEAFTLRYNLVQVFIQLGDKVEARRQLLELAKAIQASGNQRYAFLLERTVATLQALERGQL